MSTRMGRIAVVAVCLAGVSASALGQAVARRGERKDDPNELGSPMVLEAPLLTVDPARWNDTWVSDKDYADFRKYHCEGIYVGMLTLRAKKANDKQLALTVRFALLNPNNNHDKSVRVRVAILNGEDEAVAREVGPIKVEESDSATRDAPLLVPLDQLKADPPTTLKLTISAHDV